MRLYQFKNSGEKIDVVVVTDGSGDQKNVFITESPRGISVPGNVNASADNPNDKLLGMGFDFFAGVEKNHSDFVLFAIDNGLSLVQWSEGFEGNDPIELVPENLTFEYSLSTNPTSLAFPEEGGVKSFEVKSIKKVTTEGSLKGMEVKVPYKTAVTGNGFTLEGDSVVAADNAESDATGTVTVTQLEPESGAKTATISITQEGGRPGEL